MITRSEILRRAASVWPEGTVEYNPAKLHEPDGYRQDAAGFISMCWNTPAGHQGGPNIISLDTDGWLYEIKPLQLRAGDVLGVCGPAAGSTAGMLILFEGWANNDPASNAILTWSHLPNASGPLHRIRPYPGGVWRCYRYIHVVDGA